MIEFVSHISGHNTSSIVKTYKLWLYHRDKHMFIQSGACKINGVPEWDIYKIARQLGPHCFVITGHEDDRWDIVDAGPEGSYGASSRLFECCVAWDIGGLAYVLDGRDEVAEQVAETDREARDYAASRRWSAH